MEDIERSTLKVVVDSVVMRSRILGLLRYKKTFVGRGLVGAIPELGLMPGDRLEPSLALMDVARFGQTPVPFEATFWRMTTDDRCVHSSPLFWIPGIRIDTQGPDTLHVWALGPVVSYVGKAIWFLVKCQLYNPNISHISPEDCAKIALLKIKNKLMQHYRLKRADPEWRKKGSEVWGLTLGMLGKAAKPIISVKAAEAKGLLEFCVALLTEDVPRMGPMDRDGGALLLACGASALKVQHGLRNNGQLELSVADRQQLLNDYMHFVLLWDRAGGVLVPKHHMMMHMLVDCKLGAPWLHATYRDESFNGVVRGIARSCHRSTFGETVHLKLAMLQSLMGADVTMHMH